MHHYVPIHRSKTRPNRNPSGLFLTPNVGAPTIIGGYSPKPINNLLDDIWQHLVGRPCTIPRLNRGMRLEFDMTYGLIGACDYVRGVSDNCSELKLDYASYCRYSHKMQDVAAYYQILHLLKDGNHCYVCTHHQLDSVSFDVINDVVPFKEYIYAEVGTEEAKEARLSVGWTVPDFNKPEHTIVFDKGVKQ